ncbi:MAG: ribbon-helix-helix protein, CopG family [Geodermatophilaceae bacterium]|nr:ribbon-helix-helix protein, CopG family [Geodermatophilaceae bacterium]MDQ3474912.1 ribbon-helix-helix domain-containing protein [Actinomycetota bacterium]
MSLSERTQVLLSPEQRRRLERLARHEGKSVGAVIREAIEKYTVESLGEQDDLAAVFALDLPVSEWADMKAEIMRAATP